MKDLLQKAFDYGQKFEGRGGDENYSFEQFLADNNQALQLKQGGVSGSFPNQCSCLFNHGTNCFTGNCTVCGLRKDNYVKQEKSYSEKDMIESAKYGYEYHATTSFPEKSFENNCKNNFLQHLSAKFGKNYR